MTDEINEQDKPKKLTLSTNKLSLNRPIDPAALRKSYVTGKTNSVTVEVKKRQGGHPSSLISSSLQVNNHANHQARDNSDNSTLDSGLSNKLNLLKRAAEDAKVREQEQERRSQTQSQIEQMEEEAIKVELATKAAGEVLASDNASLKDLNKILKPVHKQGEVEEKAAPEVEKTPVKVKWEESKKLRKNDIYGMLESDDGDSPRGRTRSLASIKRAREKEKRKLVVKQDKVYREVIIPELITVGELASRMSERVADVIKELMKLGMIANSNQNIDADTAEIIVTTMGHTPKRVQESDVENTIDYDPDNADSLKTRAPVVTVMGHVDHGKTSLLDALKSTDVAAREAGGITQHIGAYRVNLASGKSITFIDTPGHAAFTEMRSRGARVTDIVVLVVAADDGIMTQTIEAINHARAAKVPIIVAVNKIDKPDANIDKVKQELLSHNLVAEDFGGDILVIPVSATKKLNLDKLEEAILLVAEMGDLRANPEAAASGAVIESRVDKGKGVLATLLVSRGTLKNGDIIVAGTSYGRVKRMNDHMGNDIEACTPSMPAEVWGLAAAPLAGETFSVVQSEKQAREIAEYRIRKAFDKKNEQIQKSSLEEMFLKATGEGGIKELPVLIKADVQGSLEAIMSSISKIVSDEVRIKVIHSGVGAVTESDVALTSACKGIILAFNVRAGNNVAQMVDKERVDLRYYSIIYDLIDDVESIVVGMLSPIIREIYIGSVDIREVFNITKVGKVAGSYVTRGVIKRGAGVRLLRDNVVIHEGKLKTLKRFKDEVKEVRENYECGIAFENYEDIRVGDQVEVFEIVEEKRTLDSK